MNNQILKTAGHLQAAAMVIFLLAACAATASIYGERYILAAINGGLMLVNFILYQRQSTIIRQQLDRAH